MKSSIQRAKQILRWCDELAAISGERGQITRTFASPAMRRANRLVGSWMRQAGLTVTEDAAYNLLGRWNCGKRGAKTLLLGSHLDTVRNAGKYDGPLGVLAAIAAVAWLRERKIELPFNVEVAGFSDEEGVRYQTTYLGSRALAGTLTAADLARIEEKQITKAKRARGEFFAYAELHIEQGPVLEQYDLPVGVVTAIAGQSRLQVEFQGTAGHAGTVPMELRHDALAGAADLVLAAERCGVLATVGKLAVEPGASNVIPGQASLTLDVRHQRDARRRAAVASLHKKAQGIAKRRGLKLTWKPVQETGAVRCDKQLTELFSECIADRGLKVLQLPSGAGHDGVALSAICPVALLFVRCKGGVSHHPAEAVTAADVMVALGVFTDFIETLAYARS
jgi:allantoate deiminase